MTYTLTVNADTPGELAELLAHLSNGSKPAKSMTAVLNGKEGDKKKEDKTDDGDIKVTKEMVRELTAEKVQAGKSAKVKELLKKYNAKNAATVPEESFVGYYNDLKAL